MDDDLVPPSPPAEDLNPQAGQSSPFPSQGTTRHSGLLPAPTEEPLRPLGRLNLKLQSYRQAIGISRTAHTEPVEAAGLRSEQQIITPRPVAGTALSQQATQPTLSAVTQTLANGAQYTVNPYFAPAGASAPRLLSPAQAAASELPLAAEPPLGHESVEDYEPATAVEPPTGSALDAVHPVSAQQPVQRAAAEISTLPAMIRFLRPTNPLRQ
jgi:hypothetical protein